MRALAVIAVLTTTAAAAPVDDISPRTIVFARGTSLIKADGRGKGETQLAALPAKRPVRALRVDAQGSVLLADLGGTWSWMPLDGSTKALTDLPCETGPAQLSNDGAYVLCRAKTSSVVVNLKSGKVTPIDVPAAGARLTGSGTELRLVWADGQGVWSAVPPQKNQPKKVAPDAPLRNFLVSPDGGHAVGVFHDEVYEGVRVKKPADVLMTFALDGNGARRKAIQNGLPVEWSQDSRWVLLQDGRSACIMLAAGGQYKCWRGYTAAALSPDGKYALVFGSRDLATKKPAPKKPAPKKGKGKGKAAKAPAVAPESSEGGETEPDQPDDATADDASDDVPLAPPGVPVALYRAELDGAFTKTPQLVTRDVAGAAVWIPAAP